jgi:hypothetical protein
MDQKSLYMISWTDFIADQEYSLKICGNVDKIDC